MPQGIVLTIKIQTTMQNFDELTEGFHGLVEGTHFGWGKPVDSFTRGDTATMTLSDEQGEAVQKRLLSMIYFNKREIKKMRHLVTHGYELMFEYTDAEGRDYSVIVGTPRELRLLMERTHRARTNWCRVESVPVPKMPDELRIATYSRADLLRVYRKYGGCEGCPHRRDNDPDYPEGCECPDELPCLSEESQGDNR